jgi:hypothetical protein
LLCHKKIKYNRKSEYGKVLWCPPNIKCNTCQGNIIVLQLLRQQKVYPEKHRKKVKQKYDAAKNHVYV